MASVSVLRSYVKGVLGTKTFILPTQWVTVCTFHWALQLSWQSFLAEAWFSWLGQIKTKVLASQSLHWTLLLTEGVVSKEPPPYPTSFDRKAWSIRAVPGLSSCTDQDVKPPTFLHTGLAWGRAVPGATRKPSGHVLTKSDRYKMKANTSSTHRTTIGSWSNYEGRRQRWRQNTIYDMSKTTALHVHHAF